MTDNLALIKASTGFLKNVSGGLLAKGAIGVIDNMTARAFTTTTTAGESDNQVVVVLDTAGIADDAVGKVALGNGIVPQINLTASANFGDFIKTSTTPGEGVPHAPPRVEGDFAIALDAGETPPALMLGSPYPAISAGSYPTVPTVEVAPSGTLTTTSSSYTDVDGSNLEITISKVGGVETDLILTVSGMLYVTAVTTIVAFALAHSSSDTDIHSKPFKTANAYSEFFCHKRFTGLTAGAHVFRLRWKRVSGSGTLTTDANARFYMQAQEVQA